MKKKIIASSILTMLMAGSLIVGGSYALFTSQQETNISVSSGKVDLKAVVDASSLKVKSMGKTQVGNTFANGGTATINGNELVLDKATPGDAVEFSIKMQNYSNVNIQYRLKLNCESGYDLFSLLKINTNEFEKSWTSLQPDADPTSPAITNTKVKVELPETAGNEAQNLTSKMKIVVEAVQGNAEVKENSVTPQVTTDQGKVNVEETNTEPVKLKSDKGAVKVSVPASRVEGQEVGVTVRPATQEEEGAFTIDGYQDAVYYDIDVTGINETEEMIEVSMFVGKNLGNVTVLHNVNGEVVSVDNAVYNENTGYVTFTTSTFSVFAIKASPLITLPNSKYPTTNGTNLAKAIAEAPEAAVIKLLSNKTYELQDTCEIVGKDITLVGGEGTIITRDDTNPDGAEAFFKVKDQRSYLTLRNIEVKDNYEDLADGKIAPFMIGRYNRTSIRFENVLFSTEIDGTKYSGTNPARVAVKEGNTCFVGIDCHDANVGHVNGYSALVMEDQGNYTLFNSNDLGLKLWQNKEFKLTGDIDVVTGTTKDDYQTKECIRFSYSEPLTLNLNNHNISFAYDSRWNFDYTMACLISLESKDDLTIKGNGVIDATLPNVYSYGFNVGTIKGRTPKLTIDGPTIIAHTNQVSEGSLTIENATFKYPEGFNKETAEASGMKYGYLLNCLDGNYTAHKANIIVNGGTFYDFNPADNTAEGAHTNFLSKDVICIADGNKYTVASKENAPIVKVTTFEGKTSNLSIKNFRDEWNKGTYYNLANPATIELLADAELSANENWAPIGNWQYPFNGTFNGNGHTINNLNGTSGIDANGNVIGHGEVYGLFGIVGGADATIKNFNLTNLNINIPDVGKNVGGIVGYAPNSGKYFGDGNTYLPEGAPKYEAENTMGDHDLTIENVTVGTLQDTSKVLAHSHVGGLVGKFYASGNLTIKNCKNYADVTSDGNVGGVLGFSSIGSESITFDHVENYGLISGGESAGGIASYVDGITTSFISCTNNGNVTSTKSAVGGILGILQSTVIDVIFDNCTNNGDLSSNVAKTNVGGIYAGNYGAAKVNATIHFKNVISNTGALTSGDQLHGEIIGRHEIDKDITTVNSVADVPQIDVSGLASNVTFEISNLTHWHDNVYILSINLTK